MKNKIKETNNTKNCAGAEASSACIVRWHKQCSCKGYSSMPGWTNKSKLTGDKYSISVGLIQEPVCEKCGKPWKLVSS